MAAASAKLAPCALAILIPVSLLFLLVAVAIFFWAIRKDQFEDLDSPGILPLLDAKADSTADAKHPSPQT